MLISQFDKFVNRSTREILGSEIEHENLEPMLSTDIARGAGDVTGVKGEKEVYYRTGNVNLTPADIGALDEDNVYNGLDQTDPGYALDARQGKVLGDSIDNKLDKANVYNGLDKTAAGYALDARQGKALNDKINATQSDIAIIIDGNQITHTGGAAIGEFVLVRNSTISGITDGLYTAAQVIPANTAIDSTYLAAVDGGGLNAIQQSMATFKPGDNYFEKVLAVGYITGSGNYFDFFIPGDTSQISSVTSVSCLTGSTCMKASGSKIDIDGTINIASQYTVISKAGIALEARFASTQTANILICVVLVGLHITCT